MTRADEIPGSEIVSPISAMFVVVNAVAKIYPDVSQFWTYDPEEFLKHPVYNRETWPGSKNIEP